MTTTVKKTILTFPAEAIAETLTTEISHLVGGASGVTTSLDEVEVDSLLVVEVLAALDDMLPFEVDHTVVDAGGYDSVTSAVTSVVAHIEEKWNAWHQGGRDD